MRLGTGMTMMKCATWRSCHLRLFPKSCDIWTVVIFTASQRTWYQVCDKRLFSSNWLGGSNAQGGSLTVLRKMSPGSSQTNKESCVHVRVCLCSRQVCSLTCSRLSECKLHNLMAFRLSNQPTEWFCDMYVRACTCVGVGVIATISNLAGWSLLTF